MATQDPSILEKSRDPNLLMKTAVEYGKGRFGPDHRLLYGYLDRVEFLERLDSEDDYLGPPTQLRLARVMKILMENPAPSAKAVLVSLTTSGGFLSYEPRQELLIRALAEVRPAPMEAVRFWEEHTEPDAVYLFVAMKAIADNGSKSALTVLVRRMADPAYEEEDKVAWMRDPILRHRNEVNMLEACGQMLAGSMPVDLRPQLVEALFDYQPQWYLSCNPPGPPPRLEMTEEAKRMLRMIGQWALQSIPLDVSQRAAVELGLQQIGTE